MFLKCECTQKFPFIEILYTFASILIRFYQASEQKQTAAHFVNTF